LQIGIRRDFELHLPFPNKVAKIRRSARSRMALAFARFGSVVFRKLKIGQFRDFEFHRRVVAAPIPPVGCAASYRHEIQWAYHIAIICIFTVSIR
jgi:hypothetical protein